MQVRSGVVAGAWMTHRDNDVAYSTCMFLRISSARDPQHETVMMMMTVIDDGDVHGCVHG